MSTTSVPDITVHGGDSPSDELLERLADLLIDLSPMSAGAAGTTSECCLTEEVDNVSSRTPNLDD